MLLVLVGNNSWLVYTNKQDMTEYEVPVRLIVPMIGCSSKPKTVICLCRKGGLLWLWHIQSKEQVSYTG